MCRLIILFPVQLTSAAKVRKVAIGLAEEKKSWVSRLEVASIALALDQAVPKVEKLALRETSRALKYVAWKAKTHARRSVQIVTTNAHMRSSPCRPSPHGATQPQPMMIWDIGLVKTQQQQYHE